jgi:predicted PhzF superfamily epimerase YddE/YHI9
MELTVLRVFCGDHGTGGNPLGVFVDGGATDAEDRQRVAADLGFSETVFVEDPEAGRIAIHTPAVELGFAGHPTVGTGWLLAERGLPVDALRPPAGVVEVRREGEVAFATARPEWSPSFEFVRLESPAAVDALEGPPGGHELIGAYAFIEEKNGLLRSRVFASGVGVPEDEATGAAALKLCAQLGRPLDIRQGRGSRILARPMGHGRVEIGGRVALDGVRDYSLGTSGTNSSS